MMSQPLDGCRFPFLFAAVLVLAALPAALWAQGAPAPAAPAQTESPGVQHHPTPDVLALGAALFNQDWAANDAPAAGDGLGPLYNARSCVQCHRQGGVGGGGDRARDVELLAVAAPLNQTRDSLRLARNAARRAESVHPRLVSSGGTVVLHNFGRNDAGKLKPYEGWRQKVRAHRELAIFDPFQSELGGGHSVYVVRRNTPALFGAGLIDAVPDKVLVSLAQQQADRGMVSGRVSRLGNQIGRFGWRGQMPTLRAFVVSACANELGLSSPQVAAPVFPLGQPKRALSADQVEESVKQGAADLTDAQCDAITEFVASLPAPPKREISGLAAAGEKVFQQIGCAECHPRDLGKVQGIYSDLLLHDMGQALEDPIAAQPQPVSSPQPTVIPSGYSGGGLQLAEVSIPTTRTTQEWRTPPLWGLAKSAPYLHDGRAQHIDDAIRLHGGEAEFSADRYADLAEADRQQLLQFLATLDSAGQPVGRLSYD
jgi:CxxC motif-containing protein (DUF1111 family)